MSEALHRRLEEIWCTPKGLRALTGVNHTTVGLRFIVTGFVFFLVGGVLAMLIRSQLAFPGNDLLGHRAYNAAFTLHGTAMMFFFAVPIMEGFAVYLIPKLIGARDLVFPRLSAFGYWCYLFGGLLLFSSVLVGDPPDSGWFMYTPLSSKPWSPGLGSDFWLLGVTFAEISAVAAAIELTVSILKTRAPGMTLARMPLFAWYILVTSLLIVFGFPPLILASILLEVERAFGLPFFAPHAGGDPLLWQHLFWLFGHPEVYIIFLPAAGLVSTLLPAFAQRPIAGYAWVVLAVIATGFLSYALWVHHMFATGIPLLSLSFFSAASMAVAIPSGIQVFAWIATLWAGRPLMKVPLLFVLGFLFIFVLGGLTGVMVALVPFDWQAHDSHFVVAHLHYVLFGGMVFPLFAGLYYWMPLVTGRQPSETGGRVAFWLIFIGFNLTFLPMHWTGLLGMPRRVYTYPEGLGWELLNLVSTVGGFLTAAGVAAFLIDIALQRRYGPRSAGNAWNAGTLEWSMRSPVPSYNFASQPAVDDRDPLWREPELAAKAQAGAFYLGHPEPQRREMMVTSALHAEPQQVAILPGNTWTPLVAALLTGLFFLGFLVKAYWLAALGAALAVAALAAWAWQGSSRGGPLEIDAGLGARLPFHYATAAPPGYWGGLVTLIADATLYASLLFAYFFLWTVSPAWPPQGYRDAGLALPALGLAVLVASSVVVRLGRGSTPATLFAMALAAAFVALEGAALLPALEARSHAYDALVFSIWGYAVLHVAVAILMAGFVIARRRSGYHERVGEARVAELFWHYAVAAWAAGFLVVHVFPFLVPR
ncbi:MAG TPA: cytochrome c oxidase subunit I [Burkholderiales bacterium]|nr:cytochrome c oxidase subunit I [Burkholderiales bacterium]